MDITTPAYLNTPEAAEYLSISPQFLEAARVKGGGPAFIKVGRSVRYAVADLDAWMASNRRNNTAEG